MQPIAEFRVTARPGRRIVEIYDADVYLGDEAALEASRKQVVAGTGHHLYLQPDIRAHVAVRIWPTPPQPPAQVEGHVPVTLESETGTLVINQLTLGPAGEATLPPARRVRRPCVVAWKNGNQRLPRPHVPSDR
ncbi:hypothetical protein [Streptomyces peucetius]